MRVSEAFGELILQLKGADTFGKASLKTEISKAYLVEMVAGKVPSLQIVEKFLATYAVPAEKAREVYDAAGYAGPAQYLEDITKADRVRESVAAYLVKKKGMQPEEVKEMFEEINEKGDPL